MKHRYELSRMRNWHCLPISSSKQIAKKVVCGVTRLAASFIFKTFHQSVIVRYGM